MPRSDSFRLVSYNLNDQRVDERHESVVRCIEQLAPHILCTQEGSPEQLYNIQQSLLHPDWLYVGNSFDEWDTANAIFYRSDLFELVRTDTFWLTEKPTEMGKGWDAQSVRACTWAVLRQKGQTRQILVYNAHLDCLGQEARLQSVLLILRSIHEQIMVDSQLTLADVLIAGDFNNWPAELDDLSLIDIAISRGSNAPEILLLKTTGFIDTCLGSLVENFSTFNNYHSEPYGPKLDFIWCQKEGSFRVQNGAVSLYRENGQFCSDHCPVYADLQWCKN